MKSRTCKPKVTGSSLLSGRNCWWGEWITSTLSPPSIPRLKCPWARHRTPNCSLGAAALTAHCSGCVFTVCVFIAVWVYLDGLNASLHFKNLWTEYTVWFLLTIFIFFPRRRKNLYNGSVCKLDETVGLFFLSLSEKTTIQDWSSD